MGLQEIRKIAPLSCFDFDLLDFTESNERNIYWHWDAQWSNENI